MVWIDSISELDFYSRGASDYCYCDLLVQPSDLELQGILRSNSVASELKIIMYTTDGVTQLGDVTEFFSWYIAKISGRSFFIAKLKFFPEIMCANRCFVLRVAVDYFGVPGFGDGRPRFDRMTQQYCLADCCTTAEEVVISGVGVYPTQPTPEMVSSPVMAMCRPLLRIEVAFDCVDRWTGDFWKVPAPVSYVNGTTGADGMFAFTKVLNITGTVLDQPREIIRNISATTCRVQRTESVRLYELQSFEEFPLWKFHEISDMLHAPAMAINGRNYRYPGGVPFETLYPRKEKKRYFRLKMPLQDCLLFQNYGCADRCEGDGLGYYAFSTDPGIYFDDAGRPIGTFDDLLIWFNTSTGLRPASNPGGRFIIDGAIEGSGPVPVGPEPWTARVMPDMPLTVDYFAIIEATGDNLPAYIYAGSTRPSDRVYRQDAPESGDFNELFGVTGAFVACKTPEPGVPTFADMVCQTPLLGTPTYIDECKKPVLGVPVYGDFDEPPVTSLTDFIIAEDGTGKLLAESTDPLIQE